MSEFSEKEIKPPELDVKAERPRIPTTITRLLELGEMTTDVSYSNPQVQANPVPITVTFSGGRSATGRRLPDTEITFTGYIGQFTPGPSTPEGPTMEVTITPVNATQEGP